MKPYYPCPVCFTKGRAESGIIEAGKLGYMFPIPTAVKGTNIVVYHCECGAELLVSKEEAEEVNTE